MAWPQVFQRPSPDFCTDSAGDQLLLCRLRLLRGRWFTRADTQLGRHSGCQIWALHPRSGGADAPVTGPLWQPAKSAQASLSCPASKDSRRPALGERTGGSSPALAVGQCALRAAFDHSLTRKFEIPISKTYTYSTSKTETNAGALPLLDSQWSPRILFGHDSNPRAARWNPRTMSAAALTFRDYDTEQMYDELIDEKGNPRVGAELLIQKINSLEDGELARRQAAAERLLFRMGITFSVYGDTQGTEKIFPFDIIPRVIGANQWARIEQGLVQRIEALNLFIDDVYHAQKILKDGVIPQELVLGAKSYRQICHGLNPPRGIWCHITGTDLVRDREGQIYVLEDNLRCPSGVSYVLQNRQVMKRSFPQLFEASRVRPVVDYPSHLLRTLGHLAPSPVAAPTVVVLTPGIYNSAYFEHSFLAQQMGVELVEGSDLVVQDGFVCMKTTAGLQRVDVIYRRIDDDFLDPQAFREDSLLGIPGVFDIYRRGHVALANAPGTGIADDKVLYAYVEKMIRYYLDQDAIIPNVPTYVCFDPEQRRYVLEHLDQLVVKSANESGGYGMLIGPHARQEERDRFADLVRQDPRNYIAQPTLTLSRVPTIVDDHFEGRHVDLRPYILYGEKIYVLPGGLTRVALKKGSLVVNSSQGGGSKDTWVIAETRGEMTVATETNQQQ